MYIFLFLLNLVFRPEDQQIWYRDYFLNVKSHYITKKKSILKHSYAGWLLDLKQFDIFNSGILKLLKIKTQ